MMSFVAFALFGAVFLHQFTKLPSVTLILALSVCWILSAVIFCQFYRKNFFFKIILGFFAGFLWTYFHAASVLNQALPTALEGQLLSATGIIWSIPECDTEGCQFEFKIDQIDNSQESSQWKNKGLVSLYWRYPKTPPQVGEIWHLSFKLKRPHAYFNPGSFDSEKHFFYNRIAAKGSVSKKEASQKIEDPLFKRPIHRLREAIQQKMSKSAKKKHFLGIVQALATGLQGNITDEQWEILRKTGTAHLVAISGLHVGLLTGFIFQLIKVICRFFPKTWIKISTPLLSAGISLGVASFYAALAGFSIPTQRALIMIAVILSSMLLKRKTLLWRNYFLALALVIFIDPLAILAPGFWLSYGAVGIILYGMQGRLNANSFWWRWGRAQWVVFLGLIPFSISLFGSVSLISPLANFIAIPWVSFIVVPLALMGSFSQVFLELSRGALQILWPILIFLSELPLAYMPIFSDSFIWVAIAFLGVLWCLTPKGFPGKPVGIFCFLPLFYLKPYLLQDTQAKITVLDVGQGLSTVVETKNHTLVFDTGPKLSKHFNTGDVVVLPFLQRRKIQAIDLLLISHGDNDHAGSSDAILKKIPVRQIMTSEPQLFPTLKPLTCIIGQHWEWDGVRFEILHPMSLISQKRNDHACVLKVTAGMQSVLLTADIEARAEQEVLQHNRPQKLAATVLLVPHHGSKSSSTRSFIQSVNPKFAIIPVGYRNAYKHPHTDVVVRYQNEKITLFNTVTHGAVSFTLNELNQNPEILHLKSYRLENLRYWHHETRDLY